MTESDLRLRAALPAALRAWLQIALLLGVIAVSQPARAVDESRLAALQAQLYRDPGSAPEALQAALDAGWLEGWRANLLRAEALYRRNQFDASLQALAEVEAELRSRADAAALARLHALVAQNFYRLGSLDQAMLAAREAESSLDLSDDPPLRAQVHNIMGAVHLASGDRAAARADFERSLALFSAAGSEVDVAKLNNNLGALLIEDGQLDAAEPYLRTSLALARKLERSTTIIPNLVNLSELHARRGEHAQARQAAEECFELARASADESSLVWCHEAASFQLQAAGELDAAIQHARDALQLAERDQLQQHEVELSRSLAAMLGRLGQHEEAAAMNDRAFRSMATIRDQLLRLRLQQSTALIDYERARAEVQSLQLQARHREHRQQLLWLGLAILTPLLLASLWLLRSRSQAVRALAAANQRNARLALTDSLTGLPNRRALLARLHALEQQAGQDYVLALIDVDHFKALNDRCGHEQGDAALRRVASTLQAALPPSGMAARWGGEEFIVLLPDSSLNDARRWCRQIQQALRVGRASGPGCAAAAIDGEPASMPAANAAESGPNDVLTVSIGLARSGGQAAQQVIARADQAMYSAKRLGRDRIESASEAGTDTPSG